MEGLLPLGFWAVMFRSRVVFIFVSMRPPEGLGYGKGMCLSYSRSPSGAGYWIGIAF